MYVIVIAGSRCIQEQSIGHYHSVDNRVCNQIQYNLIKLKILMPQKVKASQISFSFLQSYLYQVSSNRVPNPLVLQLESMNHFIGNYEPKTK